MNEEEALRRLSLARVARMATVDAAGAPHVVPMVFAVDGETLYWAVDRKPKRSESVKRLDNIRGNPQVQVVADHYEEDWGRLWWVRATGVARIVEEPGERTHALALLASKYRQYRDEPPQGAVVAVELRRLASWEGSARL